MSEPREFSSFREFWPFYLSQHQNAVSRRLHFVGFTLGILGVMLAFWLRSAWLLLPAAVVGYGLSWVGHLRYERNRPATWRYPLWSFAGDLRMYFETWAGLFRRRN